MSAALLWISSKWNPVEFSQTSKARRMACKVPYHPGLDGRFSILEGEEEAKRDRLSEAVQLENCIL